MTVSSGILVRTESNEKERMIIGLDSVESQASRSDVRYLCLNITIEYLSSK